jgi:hypothetical protein
MTSVDERDSLERELAGRLTEGQMKQPDPQEAARQRLSPKYEIRIPAQVDPIAEEIKQYRKIAKEIDDRYDSYLERVKDNGKSKST